MIRKLVQHARKDNATRKIVDGILAGPTILSALHLRGVKRFELRHLPLNRRVLDSVGLHPVVDHYYEPFVSERHLHHSLDAARDLPGVDLRVDEAIERMGRLSAYADEPLRGPVGATGLQYEFDNGTYGGFDGSLLYALVRDLRPRRVLEVGGGNSTLVVERALACNRAEGHDCRHICVEPFEMPWLEQLGIEILRSRVESLPFSPFEELEAGDILFIDTSHIIRPQGDVLHLVQHVLPRLRPGVWVHIHDIFTPYDYPAELLLNQRLLWNEQYVVEAFLAFNERVEVRLPARLLFREHRDLWTGLRPALSPPFNQHPPSALWLQMK